MWAGQESFGGAEHSRSDAAASGQNPSKLEAAVLELAGAGFTVQRILDVIPEPDLDIYGALECLVDAGAIAVEM